MEHIITVEEVRDLGRPISPHIDKEKLLSYIYETERLSIKPVIGDKLFSMIVKALTDKENALEKDNPIKMLLDGGEYTDAQGEYHIFSGLRIAMSYYVYAQYIIDGDLQLTRAGVVVKDGAYSSHISSKERSDSYNNALAIANGFMSEVKEYIQFAFPNEYKRNGKPLHSNALTVRKIG